VRLPQLAIYLKIAAGATKRKSLVLPGKKFKPIF
jgi:hypothetical protein